MKIQLLRYYLLGLILILLGQSQLISQVQVASGNFAIPALEITVSQISNCNMSDASINITSPLGANYEYSINEGPFQASPNFTQLSPGDYSVVFKDNSLFCTSATVQAIISTIPCNVTPEIFCDVFIDLKGLILTETSFSLVMSDDIQKILTELQLNNNIIANLLTQVNSLDIVLEYANISGLKSTEVYNVYNNSMYGDLSSFNIKTWSVEISNVNTSQFEGSYQLKITLDDGTVIECELQNLPLTTEVIDENIPETIEGLDPLSCGSQLDELPDSDELLPSAAVGEKIYIKEFPILLTTINSSSLGVYSGQGILPLPFDSRYILVEFSNVVVTKSRKIKGTVRAVSGNPISCTAPSADFGGEICIPPPPPPSFSGPGGTDINGYDAHGFDPVTKKYKDGTLYDDNGFDYDGNFKGTDPPSPYNPLGCNRDGVDIDGNECDPTQPPLPEVTDFLETNEENFGPKQNSILQELRHEYFLKLQALNCESFKNNINIVLASPKYTAYRSTAVGNTGQYLNSGLSNNFDTKLVIPDYDDSKKSSEIVSLEKNHAQLYECDLKSIKFNIVISRIDNILSDPELLTQILDEIKAKITTWDEEEIAKYGDIESQAFKDWMKDRLKEKIMEIENDNTLFSYIPYIKNVQSPFQIKQIENSVDYIDYYNSIASLDQNFGDNISSSEKEEIAFYLANGFNTIKGIDKVHYLEAMSKMYSSNGTAIPSVMPLKISNSVGSMIYTIYLDQLEFTETGAKFDACIKIEDAESGKILVFRASNIPFGPGGTTSDFRLALQNEEVSLRINNASKIHLFKEFTYVEFNCNGFVRAGIKADVEFCPNYILPIDAEGKVIPNTNYRLHIPEITMSNWMEFTFVMTAAPFAMAKYDNIQWSLTNMVIDTDSKHAASINNVPINIKAPKGYEGNIQVNSGSWKGFYVESLEVKFLAEIPSSEEVKIAVENLIIDGTGVSAYASTENIFTSGNLSGWPFTIDKVSLLVLHNNVAGFGFGGDLKLPVFTEKLKYEAQVYSGSKYKFEVTLAENLTCPLFLAEAKIFNNSEVAVVYDGSEFVATATLNGEILIGNGLVPGLSGVFPKIGVTGMQVSTKAPYFNIGTWKVQGKDAGLDFGAFKISVGLPSGYKPGNDFTNGVLLPVSLELDGKYKINASGNFAVLGSLEVSSGTHEWKYVKSEILDFCIGGSFPGVKSIDGCLKHFKDNPEFGTGFQAKVQVKFDKFLDRIDAVGLFGHKEGYKYFFVDATASLQKSIPMGAISLKGFCGGVSYHMSSTFDPGALNFTDDFNANSNVIGTSASGITYSPNATTGLGLRAGATFVLTSLPSLTNGSILIKMDFNTSGGLDEFAMKGTAQFIKIPGALLPFIALTGKPEIPEAIMTANVHLQVNSTGIFGHFECYLDAGFIKGVGDNGKLVDAVVKFTASEWYIWIGQPEPLSMRAGSEMKFGESLTTRVDAYFCMGSKIPNFPNIPAEIRKHIPSFASANSLRGGGGGIVFGASFLLKANIDLFVAKGALSAAGGFDVMLRDYSGMSCAATPGETIGLKGWYAAGQAWAMLSGNVQAYGINILSATVAAAFQARLPNPTFIEAALSIDACAIVCFDVDLHVSFGEVCDVQSNDPGNVLGTQIVSSIVPFTNTQDMALESKPQIFFNVPIQDGIKIKNLAGVEKVYNVRIKKLELKSKSLNIPLVVETKFNNNKTQINIIPKYLLPHNDSLELSIEVEVLEGNTVIQTESKNAIFYTTDQLPSFANNVKSTYPMEGMTNFYKDEVNDEYINLKQLLYDYIRGTESDIRIKLFQKGSNSAQNVPFTVMDYGRQLLFDLSPLLNKTANYELKVFEVESSQDGQTEEERELLKISFRTSNYSTFADKVATFTPVGIQGSIFNKRIDFASEPFDELELSAGLVKYALDANDYTKEKYKKIAQYTTYNDEFIAEYCNLPRGLPGCFDCSVQHGDFKTSSLLYNSSAFKDYSSNVKSYLKTYMDQILANLGFLPDTHEIYNFYQSSSNIRETPKAGTRDAPDPLMILTYYTPDGTKMSSQEVR